MKRSNADNLWSLSLDAFIAFKAPETIIWFPKFLLSPGLCHFRIQGKIFLYLNDGLYGVFFTSVTIFAQVLIQAYR